MHSCTHFLVACRLFFVPSNEHLLQGPTGEGSDLGGFMTSGDLQDTPVTVRKEHKTLTISYNASTLTIR